MELHPPETVTAPVAIPDARSPGAERLPRLVEIVGSIVILLELIAPFLSRTYGSDGPSQIYLLREFNRLLFAGDVIPRWDPAGFAGLGSPAFYFYPPLTFYAGGLVQLVTGVHDATMLYRILSFLASVASFGSAWLFLKHITPHRYWATVGAALYAFGPYRVAELYSRSSLSSHVGYAILPIVALAMVRLFEAPIKDRAERIALLACALSLLLLSSIPLAIVAAIAMIAMLVACRGIVTRRAFVHLLWSALGCGALTAFYVVPILLYRSEVDLFRNSVPGDPGYFMLHPLRDLVALANMLVLYGSFLLLFVSYRRSRNSEKYSRILTQSGLGFFLLLAFLQIPVISLPVWRHVLPFELVQNAWRLYIVLVLVIASMLVLRASQPWIRVGVVTLWAVASLPQLILVIGHLHLFAHYETAGGDDPPEYLPIAASHGRRSAVESANREIRLERALDSGEHIQVLGDVIEVRQQRARLCCMPQYYWPQRALRSDQGLIVTHPDSSGLACATLPAGTYRAHWVLERSMTETMSYIVSIVSFCIAGILIAMGYRRNRPLINSSL